LGDVPGPLAGHPAVAAAIAGIIEEDFPNHEGK
jgi:hypothetical protein